MAIAFKKLNEAVKENKNIVTVYGQPGTGKTHFAVNKENTSKGTVIIVTEDDGGLKTVQKLPKPVQDKALVVSIDQEGDVVNNLTKVLLELNTDAYIGKIDRIVIDPLTNIRALQHKYYIKGIYANEKNGFVVWGKIKEDFTELFNTIVKVRANFNVVIVTHEVTREVENGIKQQAPDIGDVLLTRLTQISDEVVRLSVDGQGIRSFDLGTMPAVVLTKTRKFGHLTNQEKLFVDCKIDDLLV